MDYGWTYLVMMSSYGTFFSSITIIARREQVEIAMPEVSIGNQVSRVPQKSMRSFDRPLRAMSLSHTVELDLVRCWCSLGCLSREGVRQSLFVSLCDISIATAAAAHG